MRINSVGSGLALADLQEVLRSPNLTTLVVPKVEGASDVHFVRDVIAHEHARQKSETGQNPSPVTMLALIESARSLTDLREICTAAPGLVSGLTFAAEDFALDLSLTRTPSLTEFLFARSAIVTAARAHDLPSTLDLVATAFRSEADQAQLVEECEDGVRMGFNGKQCIHPSQVATVDKVYSPSKTLLEWAVRLTIAQRKAEEQGRGAWTLDGKMIDAPVEGKARAIVAKGELIDRGLVDELREKHKDQEPQ